MSLSVALLSFLVIQAEALFVTGPAKTWHVGTKYAMSHISELEWNISLLLLLHNLWTNCENFIAMQGWNKKLWLKNFIKWSIFFACLHVLLCIHKWALVVQIISSFSLLRSTKTSLRCSNQQVQKTDTWDNRHKMHGIQNYKTHNANTEVAKKYPCKC